MEWNDASLMKAAQEQMSMPGSPRRFSVTERLEAEKRTLEDRLAQVNKALDALKANPDFQSIFDLISRTI